MMCGHWQLRGFKSLFCENIYRSENTPGEFRQTLAQQQDTGRQDVQCTRIAATEPRCCWSTFRVERRETNLGEDVSTADLTFPTSTAVLVDHGTVTSPTCGT